MPHRIRRITIFPVRVPVPVERVNSPEFPEPLNRGPSGNWDGEFFGNVPFNVVKIEGDGGPVGWGDSSRMASREYLVTGARALLGLRLDEVDAYQPFIADRVTAQAVRDKAASTAEVDLKKMVNTWLGLENAVLDWAARCREVPLHKLLGPQVRDRVRIEYWTGFRNPADAAKMASEAKSLGFLGLKLKARPDTDVGGIAKAILDACGPSFHVTIDPNGRWETLEFSLQRAREIVAANRAVALEDPVYGNLPALAQIRRETGVEMLYSVVDPRKMEEAIEHDACDGFNIAGMRRVMRTCDEIAAKHKKPFWIGSSIESGLGDLAALHTASTMQMCTLGSDFVGYRVRQDDLLKQPLDVREGYGRVPDGPGLGIDTDEDAVHRCRISDPIVIE